jgi:hypothetical protein
VGGVPSVGSVINTLDNALVELTIGPFKTELIKPSGLWQTVEHVEITGIEVVDWSNAETSAPWHAHTHRVREARCPATVRTRRPTAPGAHQASPATAEPFNEAWAAEHVFGESSRSVQLPRISIRTGTDSRPG